ncbi:hypothetical protein GLOTRDRAFT_107026 [Gloeophyllum trabeum ATCC 11539]|uniref:DNA damage-binding protein 1 n=1 Tax=Gloeophyllum trabeum (strain ATCC 11539 / FP-39264 / Madison 617) TaxID=670483 RepID=S7RHH4_GLOTA|nr:uncharacterized protein GLOTRDRAFT_107026 [Gloeophyllum trabeum ATCC 11539]EPQ53745.1 hypothetical protein GLOTRDRAFT_107026 [Gloeophyllum trabeum ATCC 11539]
MQALRQEILPASGVEFTTSLRLTPSTLYGDVLPTPPNATARQEFAARALCNVVVARSNILRIFEVREEPVPIPDNIEDEREKRGRVRRGTEAVEGEVEMDEQGEGFVNMGAAKNDSAYANTRTRLYLIREHRLHGTVTGMESVKIMSTLEDKLDRLLVSFKDAKIALLEWSTAVQDLITVSIHTYERAPQLMSLDAPLYQSQLRVDPLSRVAALSLPNDALAILPFYQSQAELDVLDQDQSQIRDVPYSPSFILDLTAEVDERIHNVIDYAFLSGFNNPTVAVLFQPQQTWTGRLKEYKDTVKLFIFTLDLVTRTYPVINAIEGLPYDCTALITCDASLGGVVALTTNSIIYIDATARKLILPVNGWASRVSDLPLPALSPEEQERNLQLEGSRCIFVDEHMMFLVLRDGLVYPIEFVLEGKTVTKLSMASALAQTTIPSTIRKVGNEYIFVASAVGPSALLKASRVEEIVVEDAPTAPSPATVVTAADKMDVDEDEGKRSVVHLSLCDTLPAHGPISDITFSVTKNGDRPVSELVAATGVGVLGGFTLFQRDLPTRVKRKLHAIGGGRGMWALPLRQTVKINGSSYDKARNQAENDTIIVSTDANPSPGLSRVTKTDITITTRIPGTTIGAAPFFGRTAILHVMSNAIRVLEPDGTERQVIKDLENQMSRPKIRFCSICDPFVLIIREDDSLGLFIGEPERGKIRRKDMSPMGEKTSRYLAGCFYSDASGLFRTQSPIRSRSRSANAMDTPATTTLQTILDAGTKSQWLVLVRPQGVLEIWTLPKLTLVFSTSAIATLQDVLVDSSDPPALSLPQDPPRKPQDLDIEQVLMAPLGESSPKPHLFVFLRSGILTVYEAFQLDQAPVEQSATRASLMVQFVKVASRAFDIQRAEETEKTILAEQKKILRQLIPFVTSPSSGVVYSGVFFTGDHPSWILATDKSGVRIHSSGHNVVHAFTSCSLWESKGDFLLYSDEGPSLLEWIPGVQITSELPSRSVHKGRAYSNIVYDSSTSLLVAASVRQAKFTSYDDDGNCLWEPDATNVSYPTCDCSSLELLSPETWSVMDGYEFAPNEFVNTMECVALETLSTEAGTKEFIAVGTTIDRGEDLAVKGGTYIFEVVEVVPDPSSSFKRLYRLKLRCRDDAKGPVTAVCGLNGYLVSSMGQKIYVRALDLDERLVGVAFLDVGVSVTSLRSLKNLLLIGDAVKSVWFVAFQEDPYKLAILAKDIHPHCVTNVNFFFTDNQLSIVTSDEDGIVRMYEYDPHDPESKNGQILLCRTEFHGQVQTSTSLVIARRTKDDPVIPQSKLIYGSIDGSLTALVPVEESAAKRLQLLQGQLTRNVQHVAALNPRAFRIVRNDYFSKPLTKGILDYNLLMHFESLPIDRQNEMTRQIGTERTVVLRDWMAVGGAW